MCRVGCAEPPLSLSAQCSPKLDLQAPQTSTKCPSLQMAVLNQEQLESASVSGNVLLCLLSDLLNLTGCQLKAEVSNILVWTRRLLGCSHGCIFRGRLRLHDAFFGRRGPGEAATSAVWKSIPHSCSHTAVAHRSNLQAWVMLAGTLTSNSCSSQHVSACVTAPVLQGPALQALRHELQLSGTAEEHTDLLARQWQR